jgi:hypothetical protein
MPSGQLSTNSHTVSVSPLEAAKCNGVFPYSSFTLGPSGQRSSNIHGYLPKSATETAVQCAVDFEERVEVGETELAFIVVEVMRDHEEDFPRKLGGEAS